MLWLVWVLLLVMRQELDGGAGGRVGGGECFASCACRRAGCRDRRAAPTARCAGRRDRQAAPAGSRVDRTGGAEPAELVQTAVVGGLRQACAQVATQALGPQAGQAARVPGKHLARVADPDTVVV